MNKRTLFNLVLFASLAFNLFAAGFLLGHKPPVRWDQRRAPFGDFDREIAKLPENKRGKVEAIQQHYRPQMGEEMMQVREARMKITEIMRSPDYSRAKADVAFDSLRKQMRKTGILAQTMMLDIADELSPEERAEFFKREGRRPGMHSSKPPGPPPGE